MKKITMYFLVIALLIITAGCSESQISKEVEAVESVEQKVVDYLSKKGYQEADYSLTVTYHKSGEGKMGGPYAINVIFNDEPDMSYTYSYKPDSQEIMQTGVSPLTDREGKNFKHAE